MSAGGSAFTFTFPPYSATVLSLQGGFIRPPTAKPTPHPGGFRWPPVFRNSPTGPDSL